MDDLEEDVVVELFRVGWVVAVAFERLVLEPDGAFRGPDIILGVVMGSTMINRCGDAHFSEL
ncbi:hypothetical protein IMZ48_26285 [Candidatus Bathyarchaeota archaeon]|nr:hypothetical protein [Candidatus Bathyarchaeota archaeon]